MRLCGYILATALKRQVEEAEANVIYPLPFKIVWPCTVTHSLWIKPTGALNSIFIGITTLHVSGSLSAHHQEFLAVHQHWYILCSFNDHLLSVLMTVCYQEQDVTEFHPASGSKRSSKLYKIYQCRCTAKNSWWWAERLPETCRVVIPINLEFSAPVGFIHKEFVTMHGHMILKNILNWTIINVHFFIPVNRSEPRSEHKQHLLSH
jgi:hypothetical protein